MRKFRPVVAAIVAGVLVLGVGTPGHARTDDRTKPLVYVHGWSSTSSTDCNMWNNMDNTLRSWGHTGTKTTIKYYSSDTNCTHSILGHGSHTTHYGSSHTSHSNGTDIRHLAYHLAWTLYNTYGTRAVDIVAHSMGGLITRYMVGEIGRNHVDFPPVLYVEDVVTMGTPHNGTGWANFCGGTQCTQMRPGSSFINYVNANSQNPQSDGGTDWTLMGSDDDGTVSASSATSMSANHKVIYLTSNNIGHSDFYNLTTDARTADVNYNDYNGPWYAWYDAPWPVRWSDFSVYLGSW